MKNITLHGPFSRWSKAKRLTSNYKCSVMMLSSAYFRGRHFVLVVDPIHTANDASKTNSSQALVRTVEQQRIYTALRKQIANAFPSR
jgi:hypothetical protein